MHPFKAFVLSLFLISGSAAFAQREDLAMVAPARKQVLADFLLEWMQAKYPLAKVEGNVLYVSVRSQRMYYVVGGKMQAEYVISTSKNGLGARENSFRTPEGLHRVVRKIGRGVPPFGVFESRQFTGKTAIDSTGKDDLITSRILWLGGMEPGVNEGGTVDSMQRGIYIHGTGDEASLGRPSSHGCIRMRNSDVIQLFDEVPTGALVVILDN
ncbi:MAG: L,D-transpeptidase [Flavobacteriales bacterium]|jgi:lipoprotein-anchoring transpeptidase ErfK/SrfK